MFWRYLRAASVFWLALTGAAGGLVLLSLAALDLERTRSSLQASYEATGSVSGKRIARGTLASAYYVDFSYLDRMGRRHEAYFRCRAGDFEGYQPGHPIPIRVSVDSANAWLAGAEPGFLRVRLILALTGALAGFGVWRAIGCFRDLRARVVALRHGQPARGRVRAIDPRGRVLWSWFGPDGRTYEGASVPLERRRAERWRPGDGIAIYLHPTDRTRSEADVFGFRAPLP